MKKVTVILFSMLLILVVGQSVFAKNYVGLALEYSGENRSYYDEGDTYDWTGIGFKIGLFANYYLNDRFSLAGEIRVDIRSKDHKADLYATQYTRLDFNSFGRYDVLKLNIANAGVQVGLINSIEFAKWYNDDDEKYYWENDFVSFIALGAYANVEAMPKLNIYTDLKFPIGLWNSWCVSFFEVFLYDIILGATYEISPNINLGIEGNISNANYDGVNTAFDRKYFKENSKGNSESKYFNFSIGAKVGLSF